MFKSIISNKELNEILNDPKTVVIDCRFYLDNQEKGYLEYLDSHISNAYYAHLDDDLSGEIIPGQTGRHPFPDVKEFAKLCGKWGIDKEAQVVVYDQGNGGIAARLWFLLKWLGHEAVAVLNGGWQLWQEQQFPTSNEIPLPSQKIFYPKENPTMIVTAETVREMINNKTYKLVDSRAAERYSGEVEPIDPVAGHIPSAISAPFAENLEANGLFKSEKTLKDRFTNLLKGSPLQNTVFYCGSGVTACHNLLALSYAGFEEAKLYAGSWSEWIADPNRPIETGPQEA
ncbi:MAG: sulfurtransferase [Saprospiraceae bacterium]